MKFPPDYTIKLKDGGEVPLLFIYWAFVTYGKRIGAEYEDLAAGCFPKPDGTPGPTLRKNKMQDILLIGAECYCKFNNIEFLHNPELDPYVWMDNLTWDQIQDVNKIFTNNICRISLDELMDKAEEQGEEQSTETAEGEKKS